MQGDALGDDALAALSAQRAEWVRGYLTAEGKLPADRVMVARAGAAEVGTKVSRVDFTLK
jgi:outer membrane protein OmpA-like peptidoglycan-associated protein